MSAAAASFPSGLRGRGLAVSLVVVLLVIVSCGSCSLGRRCREEERRALLEIKQSINYPNGSALPDWGQAEEDCCRWSAIACSNSTDHVVEINLRSAREVEGTWYPNFEPFTQFGELERLDLCENRIGGDVPDVICQLKHLKELYLCSNRFNGSLPPCVCEVPHLEKLSLNVNGLGGVLPPCLCDMRYLTLLGLSYNRLQGSIPSCMGNLRKLETLFLNDNEFEGTIPPSIFPNLTSLSLLYIGGDRLQGTLPFSVFANLSHLSMLSISSNYGLEVETESPNWIPSFQLASLSITRCTVNKQSGGRFPSFISTQGRLDFLRLQDTSIAGEVPLWLLCNSSVEVLLLGENKLRGRFHPPCRNTTSNSVRAIGFSHNHMYGSLPTDIGFLFPKLGELTIAGNELEGRIPPSLGRPPLYLLDLSDNNLSGKLPETLTRNQTSLSCLNVSSNELEGEMLPRDSYLPSLEFLYFDRNKFTGSISPGISNSSGLKVLDVRQNYLTGDLSQSLPLLPFMVALFLGENHLEGHLPSHLCEMQDLRLLNLFRNRLSGKIPPCLNNISHWSSSNQNRIVLIAWWDSSFFYPRESVIYFTSKGLSNPYKGVPLTWMAGLDLSCNRLDGTIPSEIGELVGLRSLNLSNNFLQGTITASMAGMASLESLDLSHNNLNGTIPPELVQLHFLSTFTVAFNHLSGVIPRDKQFSSFNKSSYEGNPELCGQPLERNCSSQKNKNGGQSPDADGTGDEDGQGILDNDVFFYSFLVLSFALGFWGFMATLFFSKRWRVKHYKVVDKYYDSYFKGFLG